MGFKKPYQPHPNGTHGSSGSEMAVVMFKLSCAKEMQQQHLAVKNLYMADSQNLVLGYRMVLAVCGSYINCYREAPC